MEFYLVRLTYTPAAWGDIIASTTSLDQRLEPVRKLIRQFGGSLASYRFFDTPHFATQAAPPFHVEDKFVMFGEFDLLTILAVPDRVAAQAFNMAVMAEPGLKAVELTCMMPMAEAIAAIAQARTAVAATGYTAPGRTP